MSDLISRRAAIDAMEESKRIYVDRRVIIGKMQDIVNNLPSAQPELNTQLYTDGFDDGYAQCKKDKEQWIPCSERLPEEERRQYWICTDTGYQCQCRWTDDVYGLGVSDRWEWKIFDIPQYQKVVAWMPLPEAYKGEQP